MNNYKDDDLQIKLHYHREALKIIKNYIDSHYKGDGILEITAFIDMVLQNDDRMIH